MMVPANRSRSAMVLQRLGLLACLAGAAGCATAGFANRGVQAEQAGDFDLAVVEYTRAVQQKPDDRAARLALDRARLRAAQEHHTRGRRFIYASKLDEALAKAKAML